MSKQYKKSPIHEAVFELRFSKAYDLSENILESFKTSFLAQFPENKIIEKTEINIHQDVNKQRIERSVGKIHHYQSRGGEFQVQIETDRLSIHHLSVYKGWSQFEPIIISVLKNHESIVGEQNISRLGLRYINHIKNLSSTGIQEIFTKPTLPPNEIEGDVEDVYTNILIKKGDDRLRIQTKSIPITDTSEFRITILDLDYYSETPNEKVSELEWLNIAHDAIELAFEHCLTEETKNTFNK